MRRALRNSATGKASAEFSRVVGALGIQARGAVLAPGVVWSAGITRHARAAKPTGIARDTAWLPGVLFWPPGLACFAQWVELWLRRDYHFLPSAYQAQQGLASGAGNRSRRSFRRIVLSTKEPTLRPWPAAPLAQPPAVGPRRKRAARPARRACAFSARRGGSSS